MNLTAKERERFDFAVIANWIPKGERVLDLGCGDGRLLRYLRETKKVSGYGVEIDHESVLGCIRNNVDVIQIDIEGGLSGFEDHSFNHVIISQALQAMRATERILGEMLRVADEAVISFPNFAYRGNREAIAAGCKPVSSSRSSSCWGSLSRSGRARNGRRLSRKSRSRRNGNR